jgi:hypothetical protein
MEFVILYTPDQSAVIKRYWIGSNRAACEIPALVRI